MPLAFTSVLTRYSLPLPRKQQYIIRYPLLRAEAGTTMDLHFLPLILSHPLTVSALPPHSSAVWRNTKVLMCVEGKWVFLIL